MISRLSVTIPMALKTRCARITRSRTTVIFFLFVLANYAAQATIHIRVLLCFSRNLGLVSKTVDAAGVQRGFTVLRDGLLEICSGIPTVHGTKCITVHGGPPSPTPVLLQTMQCAEGLTWLETYLCNSKSEEFFYLVLETWLLVISFFALTNESIPNLILVLAAQVMNTGWISYRLASDIAAKRIYDEIIIGETCRGFDILRGSWEQSTFVVALGLSIGALLCALFFVFKLTKLYSKGTLSSVGSTPVIDRLLKWRLWMRVFLELTAFFVLASAALWYDKRTTGMIAPYSTNAVYDAGFYVVAIIVLPWLVLGKHSVSKENRGQFFAYTLISIALVVISALWFGSALFRYQYGSWNCFAAVTTAANILLVATCVLSVICRLNFGKGLAHFLVVERSLRAAGFTPDVFHHGPGGGMKQVPTSDRREFPSYSTLTLSTPSLETSKQLKRPPSACSVQSSVFAAWLSSQDGEDQKKDSLQAEIPTDVIVISRANMRPCGASTPSISDDESIRTLA